MEKPTNPVKNQKSLLKSYSRFSGIAFQMIAIIGVFAFVGYQIDKWQNTTKPIYAAVLSLIGVGISLFYVIRTAKSLEK